MTPGPTTKPVAKWTASWALIPIRRYYRRLLWVLLNTPVVGAWFLVSGKKSKIMGSECSLPWDSESRSPSPTYGRYSCIRIELNIYNIIIIYIHMYKYIQECSRNETSSFNHFGWDASWGHEGGGGTGWGIKKDPIVSFILKTLSQMDRLKIFMFSGTTSARHG